MEHQAGDMSGLGGALVLALSVFFECLNGSILWLDQHSNAVVALCAIGGLILSCLSVHQRKLQIKNQKREIQ